MKIEKSVRPRSQLARNGPKRQKRKRIGNKNILEKREIFKRKNGGNTRPCNGQ